MRDMLILRLSKSGMPQQWLDIEHAARLYAQNKVLFELGQQYRHLLGGMNRIGRQSKLTLSSIIACDGQVRFSHTTSIALTNRYLFRRDNHICLYCGMTFPAGRLTRDHIIPRSRGGKDIWSNVATACNRCNHAKGARTPEEANMPLLAVPFKPNLHEQFYLMNRRILSDQMDFLKHHFTQQRHWQ